jgi:lipopolysaccharide/colanic/teichoic acid biosynthesis glycosyltransferase
MLMYDIKKLSFFQLIIKRTMDIVLSLIAIILLIPLFIIVSILIKATDGGPIFYTQDRYTINGNIFKIYKFRSMYIQKTKDVQMTTKNDKRVTPIGAIIRRTHIDELPQLFNIIKGDMSIVGPRPEMKQLYDTYVEKYPEYRYRLKMKAGLTGYAQIYGKYNTNPEDKLKFDLLYICNYSIWLDIKLILLTFKVVFAKDTSEGIEEGKTNALKSN